MLFCSCDPRLFRLCLSILGGIAFALVERVKIWFGMRGKCSKIGADGKPSVLGVYIHIYIYLFMQYARLQVCTLGCMCVLCMRRVSAAAYMQMHITYVPTCQAALLTASRFVGLAMSLRNGSLRAQSPRHNSGESRKTQQVRESAGLISQPSSP